MRGRRLRGRGPDADRGRTSSCARASPRSEELAAALQEHVRAHLSPHKYPRDVRFVAGAAEDAVGQDRPPRAARRGRGGRMSRRRRRHGRRQGHRRARSSRASPPPATASSRSARRARSRRPRPPPRGLRRHRRGAVPTLFERARPRSTCWSTTPASRRARRSRARRSTTGARSSTSTRPARSCARAPSLPGMLERDSGRIVTVASTAGRVGSRYTAGYAASKHAAVGLMRAVAAEVAGTGVTANAVCPAFVRTDMTRALGRADRRRHRPQRGGGRGGARRGDRRSAACSSPTRSRSRSRSSPPPRPARSTDRR